MEMSVREAKARFSEAIAAAERGERVIVTRHGRPVAELRKPEALKAGLDWAAGERFRREMGWEDGNFEWPPEFDDAAFSRKVLGLDD